MRIVKYNENLSRKRYLDTLKDDIDDKENNDIQQIYDIIHHHIKVVNIRRVPDVLRKGRIVKKITVQYFEGENDMFYYNGYSRLNASNVYQIRTAAEVAEDIFGRKVENFYLGTIRTFEMRCEIKARFYFEDILNTVIKKR